MGSDDVHVDGEEEEDVSEVQRTVCLGTVTFVRVRTDVKVAKYPGDICPGKQLTMSWWLPAYIIFDACHADKLSTWAKGHPGNFPPRQTALRQTGGGHLAWHRDIVGASVIVSKGDTLVFNVRKFLEGAWIFKAPFGSGNSSYNYDDVLCNLSHTKKITSLLNINRYESWSFWKTKYISSKKNLTTAATLLYTTTTLPHYQTRWLLSTPGMCETRFFTLRLRPRLSELSLKSWDWDCGKWYLDWDFLLFVSNFEKLT